MSVTVGKIVEFMEALAPGRLAEEWDNVGLLVGAYGGEVSRVLIALDAVNEVIEEAAAKECQMIVTHHPLFRSGIKKINDSDALGKKILKLIENRIALFAAHTNLDKTDGGVNDVLCQALGLEFETKKDANGENGLLRFATISPPQTLGALAKKYEKALNIPYLPIVGDCERLITKAAVCSGNGMSLMSDVIASGVELFISGDIRYHDANAAIDAGIAMLDLTHYSSEALVAEPVKRHLEKMRDERGLSFEVVVSEINAQPFKIIR